MAQRNEFKAHTNDLLHCSVRHWEEIF